MEHDFEMINNIDGTRCSLDPVMHCLGTYKCRRCGMYVCGPCYRNRFRR